MFDFLDQSGKTNYAPYLTLLGGGLGAASAIGSASTNASLMRANAQIAGMQAQSAQQSGAENAEIYRQKLQQTIGRQSAQIGGSNVTTSGSALRALASSSQIGQEDIARIQLNASRRAWGYQVQQQGDLDRAGAESKAGWGDALGGLINSGAKSYGQWDDLP